MKTAFNSILLSFMLFFAASAAVATDGVGLISGATIKKMLDDKAAFQLIDARRKTDFDAEHIVGAISLPATDVNAESLAKISDDVNSKFVFYCQNPKCQASPIAAGKAIGAGYKYVYEYRGGIDDWKAADYETAKGAAKLDDAVKLPATAEKTTAKPAASVAKKDDAAKIAKPAATAASK